MLFQDIILEVIESKDMRDYLLENVDNISKYQIIDMVVGARITLQRKYEIFSMLATDETKEDFMAQPLS